MRKTARKTTKAGKVPVTVLLSQAVFDALEYDAAAACRSVNGHIVWCIQEVLGRTRVKISTPAKEKSNDEHETRGTDRSGH